MSAGKERSASKVAVVAHRRKVDQATTRSLKQALAGAGMHDVSWLVVDKGSKAKDAARRARKAGAETVIACGGDGTVRAAAEALVGTGVALAVVPAGTANLFATALSLPKNMTEVVEAIAGRQTAVIDTGRCNGATFNIMAGTGLDAAMIDAADSDKERLGTLAYVRAGFREARSREPFEARVTIDGDELYEGALTCVLVGNLGTLKGGIQAFPDASPTDGRLDVAVVTAAGLREWAAVMLSAVRRQQHVSGHTHMAQAKSVEVELEGKHRFELDGGCKGRVRRLEFGVEPASLVVCGATVPQ